MSLRVTRRVHQLHRQIDALGRRVGLLRCHDVLLPQNGRHAFDQQARALITEIEHRKSIESALREALQQRSVAEDALRRSERELKDKFVADSLNWSDPCGEKI